MREIMKVVREKLMFGIQLQKYIGRREHGNTNGSYVYWDAIMSQACLAIHMPCLQTLKGEKLREDFVERGSTKMGMRRMLELDFVVWNSVKAW